MAISAALRRVIRERAGNRCEYCGLAQEELPFVTFHVEHIIAKQHEGTDEESNLCLACHWCNFSKGTNIASLESGSLVELFHPRKHNWSDHFERQGAFVVGLTPIGRATVRLLKMNDDDHCELRGVTVSKTEEDRP